MKYTIKQRVIVWLLRLLSWRMPTVSVEVYGQQTPTPRIFVSISGGSRGHFGTMTVHGWDGITEQTKAQAHLMAESLARITSAKFEPFA